MLITDYPTYHIFRNGSILSDNKKTRFLKISPDTTNYMRVGLCKHGKRKKFLLHRLLAIHFIPNPNNYPVVDHIDGNRLNNNLNNLRWCTQKMNMNGYQKLRSTNKTGHRWISYDNKNKKKYVVDKPGLKRNIFLTLEEAVDYLYIFNSI